MTVDEALEVYPEMTKDIAKSAGVEVEEDEVEATEARLNRRTNFNTIGVNAYRDTIQSGGDDLTARQNARKAQLTWLAARTPGGTLAEGQDLAREEGIDLDVDGVAPVKIKVVGRQKPSPPRRKPVKEAKDCFWVQVGAFSDGANARRAEAELERSGEVAVVLEGYDGLWRVRVGPFDREKDAEKARNRITDAWPGSNVIPCGG